MKRFIRILLLLQWIAFSHILLHAQTSDRCLFVSTSIVKPGLIEKHTLHLILNKEYLGQTDSKLNEYQFTYDNLGRLIKKSIANDEYLYTYNNSNANAPCGKLTHEVFSQNGDIKHEKTYTYTNAAQLLSVSETIDGKTTPYVSSYQYDTYGRIDIIHYPNISLKYVYDSYNHLIQIKNNANNAVLWTKNDETVDGKTLAVSYGNGYQTQYSYNTNLQLNGISSASTGSNPQIAFAASYQFELGTNNLLSRQYNYNNINSTEAFTYDNLDRLIQSVETLNGGASSTKQYGFNLDGNVSSLKGANALNADVLTYDQTKYSANKVVVINNETSPAFSWEGQEIEYSNFDKISAIYEGIIDNQSANSESNCSKYVKINYGIDQQRIYCKQLYYNTSVETYYVASANMEIGIDEKTYLYAEGKPFAIYNATSGDIVYLHLDYQNSLMSISDANGDVVEYRSYDAWGRPRNPDNFTYDANITYGGSHAYTLRGYCMHEHLEAFSLINMNGRVYDYLSCRFLSPDNFAQQADNTQSFNRYSYCLNNPLKYSDKNGNWFGWDDILVWGQCALTFGIDYEKAFYKTIGDALKAGFYDGGLDFTASSKTRDEAWAKADPTAKTNSGTAWFKVDPTVSGNKTNNALKIALGYYMNAPWERPQAILGNVISNYRNIDGQVTNVELGPNYVLVNNKNGTGERWGVTLGVYINASRVRDDYKHDPLFVHEFGHTIQSKLLGPLYLAKVGLPSLISGTLDVTYGKGFHNHDQTWFEINANQFGQIFYDPVYRQTDDPTQYSTSFSDIDWKWFLLFNPLIF